uniref:BTB domain-containing protein n=1 Tax=Oryza glaberrima TaxID=4538 RepID=I1QDK7_ORYGL
WVPRRGCQGTPRSTRRPRSSSTSLGTASTRAWPPASSSGRRPSPSAATTGQSASTPTALRACSPVFKAELYGGMKEREARSVTVDDTQPDVFRALLYFMYTDSLPDMDDVEDADYVEMIRLLLVAADRYAMDRMKLLCESVLDDLLDAETVGTTLALADQHSCNNLKDVCVKFMATSKGMDAVMATEGYDNLKRNCPYVLIDVLEKLNRGKAIHTTLALLVVTNIFSSSNMFSLFEHED